MAESSMEPTFRAKDDQDLPSNLPKHPSPSNLSTQREAPIKLEICNQDGSVDIIEIEDTSMIKQAAAAYCECKGLPSAFASRIESHCLSQIQSRRSGSTENRSGVTLEADSLVDLSADRADYGENRENRQISEISGNFGRGMEVRNGASVSRFDHGGEEFGRKLEWSVSDNHLLSSEKKKKSERNFDEICNQNIEQGEETPNKSKYHEVNQPRPWISNEPQNNSLEDTVTNFMEKTNTNDSAMGQPRSGLRAYFEQLRETPTLANKFTNSKINESISHYSAASKESPEEPTSECKAEQERLNLNPIMVRDGWDLCFSTPQENCQKSKKGDSRGSKGKKKRAKKQRRTKSYHLNPGIGAGGKNFLKNQRLETTTILGNTSQKEAFSGEEKRRWSSGMAFYQPKHKKAQISLFEKSQKSAYLKPNFECISAFKGPKTTKKVVKSEKEVSRTFKRVWLEGQLIQLKKQILSEEVHNRRCPFQPNLQKYDVGVSTLAKQRSKHFFVKLSKKGIKNLKEDKYASLRKEKEYAAIRDTLKAMKDESEISKKKKSKKKFFGLSGDSGAPGMSRTLTKYVRDKAKRSDSLTKGERQKEMITKQNQQFLKKIKRSRSKNTRNTFGVDFLATDKSMAGSEYLRFGKSKKESDQTCMDIEGYIEKLTKERDYHFLTKRYSKMVLSKEV